MGEVEKDYLVSIIKRLSSIYFSEVLGFCIMGNHFHLVTRMQPGVIYTDEEIKKRFSLMYADNTKRELMTDQIPYYRQKWSNLSEYIKEIKQTFSRFYNKRHKRRGFFWADRFKSVLVSEGDTLINLLAYVDLNPVRAGIVEKPEAYRWSSIGYHYQTGNKNKFLSTDFGLLEFSSMAESKRLKKYIEFVYLKGGLTDASKLSETDSDSLAPLLRRNRYFIDGGIVDKAPLWELHQKQAADLYLVHLLESSVLTRQAIKLNNPFQLNSLSQAITRKEDYLLQKQLILGENKKILEFNPPNIKVSPNSLDKGPAAFEKTYQFTMRQFDKHF